MIEPSNHRFHLTRLSKSMVDLPFVAVTAILLVGGLIMVASASMSLADKKYLEPLHFFWRQLCAAGIGLGLGWLMFQLPTQRWEKAGLSLGLVALALVLSVLIPGLGGSANGSVRWLTIAGHRLIEVSEPARLLMLMYVAGYAVRRREDLQSSFLGFLKPMMVVGPACVLLLCQPDFGATLIMLTIVIAVLFVGGARLRDFLGLTLLALLAAGALAISAPYRLHRITSFLNPWADPFKTGFQLTQSLIAVGSGQWVGLGLGESVQKLFYLPEAHTDFIFAVIAEEFGLLGSLTVIFLFAVLVWRALVISRIAAQKERFYQASLAFGFAVWQGFQVFINIGVNLGILPTKGLTLPLVSYGPSSLIVTLIAIGLLLRIDLENRQGGEGARRRGVFKQ